MPGWSRYNETCSGRTETARWILSGRGLASIEAPSGYGKSEFLRLLAEAWSGPVVWVTHQIDAEQTVADDALLLVDGITDANCENETLVAGIKQHTEKGGLAVIASRLVPAVFSARSSVRRLVVVDHHLHHNIDEIAALVGDRTDGADPGLAQQLAEVIQTNAGNWPEYEHALVQSIGTDPMRNLLRAVESLSVLGRLADRFSPLSSEDLTALAQISHFPICTDRCFEALRPGTDFLSRVRLAGYPVNPQVDGVVVINPALRRWLRSLGPLNPDAARQVYPALTANGDMLVAVRVMLAVGDFEPAVSLIGNLSASTIEWLPPEELLAVLQTLQTVAGADTDARLNLQLARTYSSLGRLQDAHREFGRAAALVEATDYSPMVKAEIRAEMLAELAFRDGELLREDIETMIATTPPSWVVAQSSLAVASVALAVRNINNQAELARAENLILGSVSALEAIGESIRAARSLRILASTIMSAQFRFREANAIVRRSQDLVRGHPRHHVSNLVLGCMNAAMLGDIETYDSFATEANAMLDTTDTGWEKAYLHWSQMIIAAWKGDAASTHAFRKSAEQHLGQILTQPTGAMFYVMCAESLARINDSIGAAEALGFATLHRHEIEPQVRFAELVFAARFSPPQEAILIGNALLNDGLTPRAKRWHITAEVALAHARDDDVAAAKQLCERAYIEAASCGDVLRSHHLHPLVQAAKNEQPTTKAPGVLEIQVLGGFAVLSDSKILDIPPGHVETLIKILAVRNGSVPVEVLIDLLWPDAAIEVARRRLKNVLLRVRTILGDRWISRTPTVVSLHPDVQVDLTTFELTARRAHVLSVAHDPEALRVCLSALGLVTGPPLPDDLYFDWADITRIMVRSRALALVDLVLKAPVDQPVASQVFDALLRVDPESLEQLLAVARRAEAENNSATFRAAVLQAKAVAETLGDPPTPALRDMLVRI